MCLCFCSSAWSASVATYFVQAGRLTAGGLRGVGSGGLAGGQHIAGKQLPGYGDRRRRGQSGRWWSASAGRLARCSTPCRRSWHWPCPSCSGPAGAAPGASCRRPAGAAGLASSIRRLARGGAGPELNALLGDTAKLLALYAALFATGLALGDRAGPNRRPPAASTVAVGRKRTAPQGMLRCGRELGLERGLRQHADDLVDHACRP